MWNILLIIWCADFIRRFVNGESRSILNMALTLFFLGVILYFI